MCDDAELEEGHVEVLNIKGIIGFDGKSLKLELFVYPYQLWLVGSTINGLLVHPNGKHVVYPLGNKVVIQNWTTKEQHFLTGHTNIISSVAVSVSGKYLASGQINHIGFKVSDSTNYYLPIKKFTNVRVNYVLCYISNYKR